MVEETKQCIKIIDFFKDQLDSDIEYEKDLFGGASIDDNGKPLMTLYLKKLWMQMLFCWVQLVAQMGKLRCDDKADC